MTVSAVVIGALVAVVNGQAARSATVIKLISVQVSQKQPTKDTVVVQDNDLINGKKAGHDTLRCKFASIKANCSIVIALAAGKLNGKLVILFSASSGRGLITGGSGKYAGANGSFKYKNLNPKGTRTSVVVTLT
jgi:hypothetical protein